MRAVVLGSSGEPELAEIEEPREGGEPVRILACGLCGSDVEKIGSAPPGTVLGHEVVAATSDGRRVALAHHRGCGQCDRCRANHETTCEQFTAPTIAPGGFAEKARAHGWTELPVGVDDATGTYVEPLACVLRGVEHLPVGRVLLVGHGFVGRLFAAVLTDRGDDVYAVDADPRRSGRTPDGPVDTAVISAPQGAAAALEALEPGGALLVFAAAGDLPTDAVYRRELTVFGSRSATERHMIAAAAMLPSLDLPKPHVLPLSRFAEGLERYRRRDVLKVVFVP